MCLHSKCSISDIRIPALPTGSKGLLNSLQTETKEIEVYMFFPLSHTALFTANVQSDQLFKHMCRCNPRGFFFLCLMEGNLRLKCR